MRFFAGFCLIANGAYRGSAIWLPVGDTQDLMQMGMQRWQLGLLGLASVPPGLWLWNGLWPRIRSGSHRDFMILAIILTPAALGEFGWKLTKHPPLAFAALPGSADAGSAWRPAADA